MKHINKIFPLLMSMCLALYLCMVIAPTMDASAEMNGLKVGELTIFSSNLSSSSGTGSFLAGHSFLSFKNTTSSSITLGALSVSPGCEITFGTRNDDAHVGIWYNVEAYYANNDYGSGYSDRVSLTMNLNQNNVNSINNLIGSNDTWTYFNNCSTFAALIWNEVSSITVSAGFPNTPSGLKTSIQSKANYQTGRSIQNATPIGYLNSSGNFVTVPYMTSNPSFPYTINDVANIQYINSLR